MMRAFTNDQKEYISISFKELVFTNQQMKAVVFTDCTFDSCDLSEAEFYQCQFIECQFIQCNFCAGSIKACKFSQVTFHDSKVMGIDWTQAQWPDIHLFSPINFIKCIISDSTFMALQLNEMIIKECKAHYVDFREGSFCNANFSDTDFSNSLFNNTNLAGTNFTKASNYKIDIRQNKITGAKFSRYEAVSLLEGLGIELVD